MKNILLVATQPQRFLDQLQLAKNINKKENKIRVFFL
jgi:hypothetical protein